VAATSSSLDRPLLTALAVASWPSRVSAPADLHGYYAGFTMALPPPQATKGKRKGVSRSRHKGKSQQTENTPQPKGHTEAAGTL